MRLGASRTHRSAGKLLLPCSQLLELLTLRTVAAVAPNEIIPWQQLNEADLHLTELREASIK